MSLYAVVQATPGLKAACYAIRKHKAAAEAKAKVILRSYSQYGYTISKAADGKHASMLSMHNDDHLVMRLRVHPVGDIKL